MGKVESIHGDWGARAALHSALENVTDEMEIIIIYRKEPKARVSGRYANTTNGSALVMIEEEKYDLLERCFGE